MESDFDSRLSINASGLALLECGTAGHVTSTIDVRTAVG